MDHLSFLMNKMMIKQLKLKKVSGHFARIKKYAILLIFSLLSCWLNAQNTNVESGTESEKFSFQKLIGEKYLDASLYHHGLYFRNVWLNGNIVLSSGNQVNQVMLRYNGFEDQLIWLSPKFGQIKLDKQNIEEFQLLSSDSVFHFKRLKINSLKDSSASFYQVGYEGKLQVYISRIIKLQTESYKAYAKYFIYKPYPEYYIIINKKLFILDRPKVKAVYAVFPTCKEKIRQRIKDNHLKIKNEADFIKLCISIEDILIQSI